MSKVKKLNKLLDKVTKLESVGVVNFDRQGNDMMIWVRQPNNTNKHWANAQAVAEYIGHTREDQVFDRLSGKILIRICNVYSKESN